MVASNLPDKRLEVTLTLQFPKYQIAGDKSLHMINEVVVHTLIHTGGMVGDELLPHLSYAEIYLLRSDISGTATSE